MEFRPASCEQAAQLASLELDAELSRFERALLKRHLARCPRCAEHVERTTALTALLRSQPLEDVRLTVDIPRRWSRIGAVQKMAGVAAVFVVGTWFGVTMADRRPNSPPRSSRPPAKLVLRAGTTAGTTGSNLDWQAGPLRAPRPVQFVPGALHMADS